MRSRKEKAAARAEWEAANGSARTHFTRNRAIQLGSERLNPVASINYVDPEEVAKVRRLDCERYELCLDVASDSNWIGFSCRSCKAYVRISDEEMVRQGRQISLAIRKGA